MKTPVHIVAGLAAGVLCVFTARADLEVSASVHIGATVEFEAPLAPHGAWVEVGSYGRCWRPAHVVAEWRPYCEGHWVWTDCGWYWESDEPWAWACYHYGSWVHEPAHGWLWVPGIEWAPAWVEWRVGGGYCGWAPRGPRGIVVAGPSFVFVETRRFHEPVRPRTVIVNNTRIIQNTTIIAGPTRESRALASGGGAQQVVVNKGPDVALVQKETGRQVRSVPIREAAQKSAPPAALRQKQQEKKTAPEATTSERPSTEKRQPERGAPNRAVEPGKTQPSEPAKPTQPEPVQPERPKPVQPERPRPVQPERERTVPPVQPERPVPPERPIHPERPKPVQPEPSRPVQPAPRRPAPEPNTPPPAERERPAQPEHTRPANPSQAPPHQPQRPPKQQPHQQEKEKEKDNR